MKIQGKVMLLVGLLAGMLMGCQKELTPRGTVGSTEALKTEQDAMGWSKGLLSRFRYLNGGLYAVEGPEMQGGMMLPSQAYGNRNGEMYKHSFTSSSEVPNGSYHALYSAIKTANFVLDNIGGVSEKANPAVVSALKGNALFVRAFCYERLMARFTKAEDPSAPGVVLLVHYDLTKRSEKRASQKEVFDQIYKDLDAADECLVAAKVKGAPSFNKISPDAVVALRARAALTQLNYDKALENAEKLIANSTYGLEKDVEALKEMWHNDAPSKEVIMQSFGKKGDEEPYTVVEFLKYNKKYEVYLPDFYPSQNALDLYEQNDVRKDIYFLKAKVSLDGEHFDKAFVMNKYPGASDLRTENIPNGMNRPKPFRIAEQYLIASESAFKKGDEAKAKQYLNALRAARGLGDVSSAGDALWKDIKDERTREMAFEGFRISDLRRWGDPIPAALAQTGTEKSMTDPGKYSLPAGDNHFVWPLPSGDVILAGVAQNPGY